MSLSSRMARSVADVAVLWVVFAVTRSSVAVAIVGIAESAGLVLTTLPAGVLVDRYDRRLLLLLSNVVRAASVGLLVVIVGYGFQLAGVVAIVFVWNAAGELYRSTYYSVLPELVSPEELADANGVTQFGQSLVGPASNALGGALVVGVGASVALAYSTFAYVAAALFSGLLLFHGGERPELNREGHDVVSEIREGVRWLVKQRGLFELSISTVVFNFLLQLTITFLVVYVGEALTGGAIFFAVMLALNVIGSALGALLVGRTNAIAYAGKVWVLVYGAGSGLLTLVLGLLPLPAIALAGSLGLGLTFGFSGNVWLTSAQNLVPPPMRGRYFAIDGLLSVVGAAPGIALYGVMISLIGVTRVYELVGILTLASAAGFASMKMLWRLDARRT
jgi:MFS family permease